MIVGNGLIATSLKSVDSDDILYFASGVSNSLETNPLEFEREFSLLRNNITANPEKKLIYFSTLSVNDQSKRNSQYINHKLEIEEFIKTSCANYIIFRIGNIVGQGGNPGTLFNFLKAKINNGETFNLHKKATRLLIDIDDIPKFLASHISKLENKIVNLSYPYHYNLKEIIRSIEKSIGTKAFYEESDEGDAYHVDFQEIVLDFFNKKTAEYYLELLVKKYI